MHAQVLLVVDLKGKETKTQVASMACLMPFKFKQTIGSQGNTT